MSWAAAIAASVAATAAGVQYAQNAKKQKEAQAAEKKALANQPDYAPTQSSRNLLADAAASKNAVNPANILAYQQAQQGAANQMANAQRNATSGTEALSVGAAAQNQLQNLIPALVANQTNFSLANRANYNQALDKMSDEERMAFEAKKAKNNDLLNYYLGLNGAYNQNKNQALMSGIGALAQFGSRFAGSNGGSATSPTYTTVTQP